MALFAKMQNNYCVKGRQFASNNFIMYHVFPQKNVHILVSEYSVKYNNRFYQFLGSTP